MSARCCVAGACRLIDFCHDAKLFDDTTFGAGPTLRGRSTQELPEKLGCQLVVLVVFCHPAYARARLIAARRLLPAPSRRLTR